MDGLNKTGMTPNQARQLMDQVTFLDAETKRVTRTLREEKIRMRRLSGQLDAVEKEVTGWARVDTPSSWFDFKARVGTHMAPSPPPTQPRARELPKIGDPSGLTSVAPVDRAAMKPIPILMIACDRVQVKRAIDPIVHKRWSPEQFPLIISQDCHGAHNYEITKAVLQTYVKDHNATLYHQDNVTDPLAGRPRKEHKWSGYYKIARHYKFALGKVFAHPAQYDAVVIVEDDLDIAPDFFEYFAQGRQLLKADPTLFSISAWNDNGKTQHVSDPRRLYRTDFFPGLGWMILRQTWDSELATKWTDRYWDDWIRLPAQRRGRACIRPEVSRTRTFGAKGVSKGQFYKKYLRFIKLNEESIDFTKVNVSYLLKRNYDEPFLDHVNSLRRVALTEVTALDTKLDRAKEYAVEYTSNSHFKRIAKSLGIMDDNKEGIFRTAYLGIVSIVWRRTGHPTDTPLRLHIVPTRPWKGYQA